MLTPELNRHMFRYLWGGQYHHLNQRSSTHTVDYLKREGYVPVSIHAGERGGDGLNCVRTSIDYIILRHLLSCRGRLLLVYPVWLDPMVSRNQSKLDDCIGQCSHSPARRIAIIVSRAE